MNTLASALFLACASAGDFSVPSETEEPANVLQITYAGFPGWAWLLVLVVTLLAIGYVMGRRLQMAAAEGLPLDEPGLADNFAFNAPASAETPAQEGPVTRVLPAAQAKTLE